MKNFCIFLLIIFTCNAFSQKLPVIKATTKAAKIYEGNDSVSGWNISPETKVDVYTTGKLVAPTVIKFKTDTDSISFKIKAGQTKDFIVLLNGKDSCLTRFESPQLTNFNKLKPEIHDSIPFIINKQNTMYVTAVFNKVDTLHLNFDTGSTEVTLTNNALEGKIKSKPKLYNTFYDLQIGNRIYKSKVYDTELSGHDTDGRFGWDIFDGMIVELNYDINVMIVHSKLPKQIKNSNAYTKLDINYFNHIFLTKSRISQSGTNNDGWFLFDTGYQRSVMLDNDLLKQNNFPADKMEMISKVMMHGATGNEIPVVTSNLQSLKLGKFDLKNVPAQILTTSKPMRGANIHILGNEVLKRFNTLLDFQENVVYLKPNSLFNVDYMETKG